MFSENLNVYVADSRRWERRTPNGVGWFPHLFTMFDDKGERTDDFDQFLKLNVEDPAAPALKKLATAESINDGERSAVAMFIALTAARVPATASESLTNYLQELSETERQEMEHLARLWCKMIGRTYTPNSIGDFCKPSSLGAIWLWAKSLQHRLLEWRWHALATTEDQPFVCSDSPVFAEWDRGQDIRLVSFPVSSTTALIIWSAGEINQSHAAYDDVRAVNLQTMNRSRDFVIACREEFPGDEFLTKWQS
jgi:hypothetical protein